MRHLARFSIISLAAVALAGTPAHAQGKSNDKGRDAARHEHHGAKGTPPGHAKHKPVTTDDAIVVARDVLVTHGYQIVRVERSGDARVIYYRRGNMGRGKGKGPMEMIIVRPDRERIVVFEKAPEKVLIDVRVRLGL